MYRFSFVESVSGQAQEVSRQTFHEIIAREQIKKTCAQIAVARTVEEVSRLKRSLPAFCWHAWFDEGKRKNYAAHPSGLIMIDVDHIEKPRELFDQLQNRAKQSAEGVWMGDHLLLAAHVTPSTRGLRLVFAMPAGLDIVQAQTLIVRDLGLKNVDACTKDLARLSFCVPEEYFLYLDEINLFEPTPCPSREGRGVNSAPAPESGEVANTNIVEAPKPKTYPEYYETDVITPLPSREGQGVGSVGYSAIVASLCELLGGAPAHGSRNNFIFSMAAYLRYVCDDDPEWIAQILPTYGEAPDRWRRTIDSACQRAQYKQMPQIVKRAIENARAKSQPVGGDGGESPLPPDLPSTLPPLIAHLVKNVPEVCRPAVANAVFPALSAHLKDVKFWLVDGTLKEATFMCVTMAKQSSGKSAVNKPIEYIIADMVERDERNRLREQEWKEAMALKGANKEKPKRPDDLCVQVLVSDMTNAAFVQRMKDAGGRYLYTNLEELDLLKQLQTNGSKDVGKIICLCFDNGKYGQERVGTQSVTARVDLRWNWNASSTIQKGIRFFQGRLVDGTLSRINLCTIVPDKSKPFVYGHYDEAYGEALKPFIDNLNVAHGEVNCPEALDLAQQLLERCQEEGALTDDDVYQDLAYRAVTIAYLKAMVLYIAHDMTWTPEIAEFVEWSLFYDLWCKRHFFSKQIRKEKDGETVSVGRAPKNLLDLLPDAFRLEEAAEMRHQQGMSAEGTRQMLSNWVFRGYLEVDTETGMYVKTEKYLELSRKR